MEHLQLYHGNCLEVMKIEIDYAKSIGKEVYRDGI